MGGRLKMLECGEDEEGPAPLPLAVVLLLLEGGKREEGRVMLTKAATAWTCAENWACWAK